METGEAAALLSATYELVIEDRVVNYCLYGPQDGTPVVSHNGSPGTRWKRPDIVAAIERSGVRMLVHDRPGYGGSTRQAGRSRAKRTQPKIPHTTHKGRRYASRGSAFMGGDAGDDTAQETTQRQGRPRSSAGVARRPRAGDLHA